MQKKRYIVFIGLFALVGYFGWLLGKYAKQEDGVDQQSVNFSVGESTPRSEIIHFDSADKDNSLRKLSRLLGEGLYAAAVDYYLSIQERGSEQQINSARITILRFAEDLQKKSQHKNTINLLAQYTEQEFRDVQALLMLAKSYVASEDYKEALNHLYRAKGYAYTSQQLTQITGIIRKTITDITRKLDGAEGRDRLLPIYEQLTQLEPDYALYY